MSCTLLGSSAQRASSLAPASHAAAGAPVASSYGYGAVPMMSVYDKKSRLPLLGWQEAVQ